MLRDHMTTEQQQIVMREISRDEILNMRPPVPYVVQVRTKLNAAGFKFEDDRKFSSVLNENPIPLGTLISWEDPETGSIHYKQVINT